MYQIKYSIGVILVNFKALLVNYESIKKYRDKK